jgi:hypothetical protein
MRARVARIKDLTRERFAKKASDQVRAKPAVPIDQRIFGRFCVLGPRSTTTFVQETSLSSVAEQKRGWRILPEPLEASGLTTSDRRRRVTPTRNGQLMHCQSFVGRARVLAGFKGTARC